MSSAIRWCVSTFKVTLRSISDFIEVIIVSLPNTEPFLRLRCSYWQMKGYQFESDCFISRGVYFIGRVTMGKGSSISNNCFLNGGKKDGCGIFIGSKVMIAPNCVIVAFDHSWHTLEIPMIDQPWEYSSIYIEDDVWVGANCTITKGVRLGKGCIVGANSVVLRDVDPYSIVGGVPAKTVGERR